MTKKRDRRRARREERRTRPSYRTVAGADGAEWLLADEPDHAVDWMMSLEGSVATIAWRVKVTDSSADDVPAIPRLEEVAERVRDVVERELYRGGWAPAGDRR